MRPVHCELVACHGYQVLASLAQETDSHHHLFRLTLSREGDRCRNGSYSVAASVSREVEQGAVSHSVFQPFCPRCEVEFRIPCLPARRKVHSLSEALHVQFRRQELSYAARWT